MWRVWKILWNTGHQEAKEVKCSANGIKAITRRWPHWLGFASRGMPRLWTKLFAAGRSKTVSSTDPAAQISVWELPDRVLLAVKNTSAKPLSVMLDIDLDKLCLVPKLPGRSSSGCATSMAKARNSNSTTVNLCSLPSNQESFDLSACTNIKF